MKLLLAVLLCMAHCALFVVCVIPCVAHFVWVTVFVCGVCISLTMAHCV